MSEQFVVSARKYRPTRFSEVVGQGHISQTLKNALRSGHVAHAFLFCGPRGVGKTTNARILAKILNCTDRDEHYEACGKCDSCRRFEQSTSFNVFELDAASNNSVDHIRALVEQVRIPPQNGKYKVFIIDEVHMLSTQAFNAFLKTLEEPPPHAIFILATTEKHKIIPTILSRCQIFDFRRIQIPDIVLHLEKICRTEGYSFEPDALHIIAQKADGALRDALSIFDRISAGVIDNNIGYNDVIENLNVLDYDYFFKITDALLAEDIAKTINFFDDVMRRGFESDIFINGLAEHFRNLLVAQDPTTLRLLEVGDVLKNRYQIQAQLAARNFLLTALNLANECDVNYKMARNKRLHVEMCLIKMTFITRALDVSDTNAFEKKTADVSKNLKNDVKKAEIAPKNDIAATTQPTPSVSNVLAEPAVTITPQISSLDAIGAMIDAEEHILKNAVSTLTYENLQKSWLKYAETHESPSTKTAILGAQLSLEGSQILASTGSELAVGLIQQELLKIADFLRFDLNTANITIEIKYDESLAPEEAKAPPPKRYLTPRDKLILMMQVNPLVKDLATRLNLKPEDN